MKQLQQYLPFTVLKLGVIFGLVPAAQSCNSTYRLRYWNFSTFFEPVRYCFGCNSTYRLRYWNRSFWIETCSSLQLVATVLTVYGIETRDFKVNNSLVNTCCNSTYRLRYWNPSLIGMEISYYCCNSTYRLRYWNLRLNVLCKKISSLSCNSTYRLRYWN